MAEKNYVRIFRNRDKRALVKEEERFRLLQDAGQFPRVFDFPITLQYELTARCNVKCKHCYNNSGENNAATDLMTPEEWIRFSQYIVSKGGIFQCVISGGEPLLLGDDLFPIMDILHDDGTSFLVISNGLLMTEEKAKRFSKYRYNWFQVSIDGSEPAFHDDFRRRAGSWERAVKAAYLLTKEGIPLAIAHSVTPGNLKNLEKMCHLAYSLGASSIILGEINPSGRSLQNSGLYLSQEEKNEFYGKIEELTNLYSGRLRIERSSTTKNQLQRYVITPNSGVIIRPNGDVRIDCMAPFILGNVLEDDFETLWKQKGISCWSDSRVLDFIQSFNEELDLNESRRNYCDQDVLL